MAQTPPRYDHRDAYRKLHDAIMNPAAREGAKNDLVVGPILKKLSLRDLDRLRKSLRMIRYRQLLDATDIHPRQDVKRSDGLVRGEE